jgi:hypothetical protein
MAAHYLPWFGTTRDGTARWSHWRWDQEGHQSDPAQVRPDGKRQIASRYYPLIGPYDSADPSVIRYHFATMKAAGIEIVLALWYGPGSDTDAVVPLLLEEAQRQGMKLAICYEEKLNFPPYRKPEFRGNVVESATADLRYLVQKYGSHPAYLHHAGETVIMQFNSVGACEIGPAYLTPTEWRRVLGAVAEKVLYVRQDLDLAFNPPLAGAYVWLEPAGSGRAAFAQAANQARSAGRLRMFMSSIYPGFDDSGVNGWGAGPRVTVRNGLDVLEGTMRDATAGSPDIVQIVTWNDFNEGTNVEPSVEEGFAYLDAIETWYGEATGRRVDLQDNRIPLQQYIGHAEGEAKLLLPKEAEALGGKR